MKSALNHWKVFVSEKLEGKSCSYILEIRLSDMELVKIFSYSVGCYFVLLTMSFALQKIFSSRRSHLLIISVSVLLGLYLENALLSNVFKCISHFLFCEVHCGWIYIEVFDPFGLEFCAW